MATPLGTPLLDDGIRNPNFFSGRLLTADDLKAEQRANRRRQRRLARALGAGVVEGLWVRLLEAGAGASPPVLEVTGGLAVSPEGQVLELAKEREEVALVRRLDHPLRSDLFGDCRPPEQVSVPTGEGVYLLVLSPSSGFQERAPVSGLSDEVAGAGCGRRWAVEGIELRLEPLNPLAGSDLGAATRTLLTGQLLGSGDAADLAKLRNVLAHLCLGTEAKAGFASDPFAREAVGGAPALERYGAVDDLVAAGRLGPCDVPLALVYWTLDGGVRFVDNWAVRRRVVRRATSPRCPRLSSPRARAEAEAALFQFQDQLAALVTGSLDPASLVARDHFRWLPAAGLLPVTGGSRPGLDASAFLAPLPHRTPVEFLDGRRVPELLERSLAYPPLSLAGDGNGFGTGLEMVWLYHPWQQEPALAAGETDGAWAIFASPHLPPYAIARFDVARWDFSNYAAPAGD